MLWKGILTISFLIVLSCIFIKNRSIKKQNNELLLANKKLIEFYQILNLWLELEQSGHSVADYLKKYGYESVAIYGYKELGERLNYELLGKKIKVKYIIDSKADSIYAPQKVYYPNENLPKTDVIIVTAIHYYTSIEDNLHKYVDCPIVNLNDVIYEALTDAI